MTYWEWIWQFVRVFLMVAGMLVLAWWLIAVLAVLV